MTLEPEQCRSSNATLSALLSADPSLGMLQVKWIFYVFQHELHLMWKGKQLEAYVTPACDQVSLTPYRQGLDPLMFNFSGNSRNPRYSRSHVLIHERTHPITQTGNKSVPFFSLTFLSAFCSINSVVKVTNKLGFTL